MSEPTPNHWAELGSTLGASPPPPEEKEPVDESAPQVPPAETAPIRPQRHDRPKPPVKRTAAADWSKLASELGAEVVEVVEVEPAAEAEPVDAGPAAAPPVESEVLALPPVEPDETASVLTDEGMMLTSWAPESDEDLPSQAVEAEPDAEAKKSGKRRRKRRRRTRKPDETAPDLASDDDTDLEFDDLSETGEVASGADDEAPADASAAGEADAPRKSRRRRRRSGRGKKESQRDAAAEGEAGRSIDALGEEQPLDEAIVVGSFEDESTDLEDTEFDGEQTATRETRREKPSHRGIPTWREAVDIVISANLEARAKRPNGRSSRQRSGHRPPQRENPGEKSS